MSDRNELLDTLARHYEVRAEELDNAVSRHLTKADNVALKAQALAMREAAAYAHQQKESV